MKGGILYSNYAMDASPFSVSSSELSMTQVPVDGPNLPREIWCGLPAGQDLLKYIHSLGTGL